MKFAIAAGHDETANTAYEILKAGGNAFDAAIAAYMTAFVAEPGMASGGGGAFANVFKADGTAQIFDFFSQTPKFKRPLKEVDFYPVEVDFGNTIEVFHIGKGASAVPGSIAGIFALHEQLGTMPLSELVAQPVRLAREGVVINEFQAYDYKLLEKIFAADPKGKAIFFNKEKLKTVGDVIQMPGLADFLDYMSREGKNAFYKGEVAKKIIEDFKEGGYLCQQDFDDYEVIIRKPLAIKYNSRTILTNPFPSIGGKLIAHAMHYLEDATPARCVEDQKHILKLYQVLKSTDKLGKAAANLRASLHNIYNKKHGSTSHFSIVDQWGNAIALTMTIGEGCGYFVEGTDIQMNNMLGEAALLPNGFHSWDPDIRLSSMMAPTIVLNEKKELEMVTGSAGASRIASAITQVLHYFIDHNLPVEEVVNLPRAHFEHGVFNIEPGFEHQLKARHFEEEFKEWEQQSLFFGGAHTIVRQNGRLTASGDSRRDGVVRIGN